MLLINHQTCYLCYREFKYTMYHRKRNISFKHDLDKIDCANWACRLLQMSYLCAQSNMINYSRLRYVYQL